MTIITKYIADDGTEFQTMKDCRAYEEGLKIGDLSQNIWVFNENKERLNLATCDWNKIWYIWFKGGAKIAERFAELWDSKCDVSSPVWDTYHPNGLHVYDETVDDWYYMPDRLAELNELTDSIKRMVGE